MSYFKCEDFPGGYFDIVMALAILGAIITIGYIGSLLSGKKRGGKGKGEGFGNQSNWWYGGGDTGAGLMDNPNHYPDQGPDCDSPWSMNAITEARALEQVGAFKSGAPYDGEARMQEQVGSGGITSEVYNIMDSQTNVNDRESGSY